MIFIINYSGGMKDSTEELLKESTWFQLKAVMNKQRIGFPGDFISWDQPEPSWILSLNWLANKIHPDLESFDTKTLITNFYADFYHSDTSIVKSNIFPQMKDDQP